MNEKTTSQPVDILLVEDQPSDADLALRALRELDITGQVRQVENGAEALDFIFCRGSHAERSICNPPRFVLLDLKLPKVSGHAVLKQIKSDERTRHIPVVVLSSSGEDSDVRRCYRLGGNSYVVKPVNFDRFTATIQRVASYWLDTNRPAA